LKLKLQKNNTIFRTLSGISLTHRRAQILLKINKIEKVLDVHIVKNNKFSYDLLLGLDAIKKFRLSQDENLQIFQKINDNELELVQNREILNSKENYTVNFNKYVKPEEFEAPLNYLDEGKQEIIRDLIKRHKSIFANNKYDVGAFKGTEAHIKLLEDRYVTKKPYRCSLPEQKEIKDTVGNLLKAGLIEESTSPFASPVTLAYKREDGKNHDFGWISESLINWWCQNSIHFLELMI